MGLDYKLPIQHGDIGWIKMFKRNKIWCLENDDGSSVVVKSDEKGAKDNFQISKTVMKVVDGDGSASKALTQAELMTIRRAAEFQIGFMENILENRFATEADGGPDVQACKALVQVIGMGFNTYFWTKMPLVKVSELDKAISERAKGNKGPLAEFAKVLSRPGGLETIGKIIAADSISGNGDRFRYTPGDTRVTDPKAGVYKSIQNVGNIMILGRGSSQTISGMDFADPNSQYGFIEKTLEECENDSFGTKWDGQYVINANDRAAFARSVAYDLEFIVSPNRKQQIVTKLGRNAAKRIESGMIQGAKEIRERLKTKRWRNNNIPSGVAQRITLLDTLGR